MANVYVTEFGRIASGVPTAIPVGQAPEILTQLVAIGAGSLQSVAFGPSTKLIRVHTDAVCSVAIGVNPTAVAGSMRMAAGQTEYFAVTGGLKIAAITNT